MARFWDWSPRTEADTATAIAEREATIESVELYTSAAMVYGWLEADGRRLSDILNTNSVLAIRDPRSTGLVADLDGEQGSGWTRLSVDDILLAMPPPHDSARQLKIHRRKHRVRIRTGPFEVVGTAHVLPGTALDPYVLRSRMHFLALTDAHLYGSNPPIERSAPVVLVNVRPVKELLEVLPIS